MQTLTSFLSRVVSLGLGRGSREAEVSERQLQRDTYRNDAVNGSEILPGMCRTPRCPDHGSTRRDSEVGRGQLSHVSRLEIYPSTDNNRPDFLSDNVPSEIKRLRDLCQDLQQQLEERNVNMKDLEEQAKKYCRELKNGMKDKCTKLESHLAEREGEIASLKRKLARQEAETNSLKSDCQKLQHDNHHAKNEWQAYLQNIQKQHISELNDLKSRWTADVNKHAQENDRLKRNLEELQADHVRSVNSIGTGLEPIADMTFEDRFRGLQEQAYIPTISVWQSCTDNPAAQQLVSENLQKEAAAALGPRSRRHEILRHSFPSLPGFYHFQP
ncbi:hypothetical protein K440DRAFT_35934 [Wilcoxina mikolae CBS 423.85]|nr:hypothetical protein K440DRAFT_35934 [Wilcoxina mikolae CBS 423.85]